MKSPLFWKAVKLVLLDAWEYVYITIGVILFVAGLVGIANLYPKTMLAIGILLFVGLFLACEIREKLRDLEYLQEPNNDYTLLD